MFSLKFTRYVGASGMSALVLTASMARAVPLHPESIAIYTSDGSYSSGSPYRDDVYLGQIVFGDTSYTYSDNMVAIAAFEVLTGRGSINAEWGDLDDGRDGDENPFSKAGFDPGLQETLDPVIQDLTLQHVFNSNSLTEMSDGEGGSGFSFKAAFSQSLIDNSFGLDAQPELVLFERGLNDQFDVRLMTGGSFAEPAMSDWLAVNSEDFARSGIYVDTVEIGGPQEIGVGAFDLDQFGLAEETPVYGVEIRSQNGSGPDLNGLFLTAETAALIGPSLVLPVPVNTSTWFLGLSALGMLLCFANLRPQRPLRHTRTRDRFL